ncbi:DUF1961 family protein [Paenibacillus abyssi]|uniref:DUF1961 domain-containing protein n=1 Tax=Paenibacillus abyssi TaxID=1340531 RepID=A0A917FN95_9BACL|nr:DUF1961 family protein [Paenibacillus abyssi]GGF95283.1 hypothetical protein GCM10010916_10810 [Paenibacillus abyssi]
MRLKVEDEELLYTNALASPKDIDGFVMEGDGSVTFPTGRMRLESTRSPEEGQAANVVYWCPQTFPDDIAIRWRFWPIGQPGLAIMFFCGAGRNGQDVLDPSLQERNGIYDQYHHGDINAYHVSYFRKSYPSERRLQTANLRKSYGFHLVAQGADPIPHVVDCDPPYRMEVLKCGADIVFSIEDIPIFHFTDDAVSYGPVLGAGKIGFRQMAPLVAEYSDLEIYKVRRR